MPFIQRLGLQGLLSFPPDMEPFDLQPLNVLIGPNGAGKTNAIEAFEVLRGLPNNDIFQIVGAGGGIDEWLWKGSSKPTVSAMSVINAELSRCPYTGRPLRYYLSLSSFPGSVPIINEEKVEETRPTQDHSDPYFYYRYKMGTAVINARENSLENKRALQQIEHGSLNHGQSILAQRKEPLLYPELSWLVWEFPKIVTFREWSFGAGSYLRAPQRADEPSDFLLSDSRNLALVLNEIQHRDNKFLDSTLKRFLPRYERTSTRIHGGAVQLFFHEVGLREPIPSTRMSDGTLRFLAMLAALLAPTPPPLLCIEEPELGLHPDAVALLAELLVEASDRTQLVVTTHSDALLSALGDRVESVLVCENNGHGTSIERLDAERLAHWLKNYSLGDIWRIGELGGNP